MNAEANAPLTRTEIVDLNEAIRRLEAGCGEGVAVDLGTGRLALANSPRGAAGLLQRLRGHRLVLLLAADSAEAARYDGHARPLMVMPEVQGILDAIGFDD